jgi:hypothetical protein
MMRGRIDPGHPKCRLPRWNFEPVYAGFGIPSPWRGSRPNIPDRILHGPDAFHIGFWDFNAERFFERYHQLNRVQAIGAKVIDQPSLRDDRGRINAEMATDDHHNLGGNVGHTRSLLGWSRSSTCNNCVPDTDGRCATNPHHATGLICRSVLLGTSAIRYALHSAAKGRYRAPFRECVIGASVDPDDVPSRNLGCNAFAPLSRGQANIRALAIVAA